MNKLPFKSVKVDLEEDKGVKDTRRGRGSVIYITGQTKTNRTIMVIVRDFMPYVFVELPKGEFISGQSEMGKDIDWKDESNVERVKMALMTNITTKYGYKLNPNKVEFVWKKKTFYANVIKNSKGEMEEKLFPYVKVYYKGDLDRRKLQWALRSTGDCIRVSGIGKIRVKLHEMNADPIIQLFSEMNMNQGGWNSFEYNNPDVVAISVSKESTCDSEYIVPYKLLGPSSKDDVLKPKGMSFDIECNSHRISAMPDAEKTLDCIFQISAVFFRLSEKNEDKWDKVLLTLGNPEIDQKENIECVSFGSERELIVGFVDLITERNPQVIMGYNILNFDIPYLIKRAKSTSINCLKELRKMGNREGKFSDIQKIKWSSSAYGVQEMEFINAHGRVFLDLLPVVKRSYKMSTYKLKNVSQKFLGVTKDPLTPQGIFKCYRMGMKDDARGRRALGICGKYCVSDSVLVARISNVIQVWIDATETARTCNVPISYLYTKGQQVRFFALLLKNAMHDNYVVEKDAYSRGENENYSGAIVIQPEPGLYKNVVPFDFASLYPTVMISNNISTETLVDDNVPNNIDDDDCNICEWEDHIGCSHDTMVRSTPVKSVICTSHRYRFVKGIKGMVARILESLLHERSLEKKTLKKRKGIMKRLQSEEIMEIDGYTAETMAVMVEVSDKRQAALKIVCNSAYGALGAQNGYLPCLPCAMCTTAWGRKYLMKAKDIMCDKYDGEICYGDTDSVMIKFNHVKDEDLWDHCMKIDKLLEVEFPAPMKLEFEEKIYKQFLIFSKKRYIAHVVENDHMVLKSVLMKGVILARRDNSNFVSSIYKECIDMIFDAKTEEDIFNHFNQHIMTLFTKKDIDLTNFIITKTVNAPESYKVELLPEFDEKERTRKLASKKCDSMVMFRARSLPSHVYLANKMGRRGIPVASGTRIEYVITDRGTYDGPLWEKIEDPKYMKQFAGIVNICPYYYLSKCVNPIDQLFEVCFKKKHTILRVYKTHLLKHKICKRIRSDFNRVKVI